jgi:hypothetical protein
MAKSGFIRCQFTFHLGDPLMMKSLFCKLSCGLMLGAATLITSTSSGVPITLTPPQSTDLVLWLKADAGVTSSDHDSNPLTPNIISQWDDQSGKNNHVATANQANMPQLIPNQTYKFQVADPFPVVRFDGVDYLTRTAGLTSFPTNASGGTVFIVMKTTGTGNQVSLSYGSSTTSRFTAGLAPTTNFNVRYRGAGGSPDTSTITSIVPTTSDYYLEAIAWDGTTGTNKLVTNVLRWDATPDGDLVSSLTSPNITAGIGATAMTSPSLAVGALFSGLPVAANAGVSHAGEIAEVLIWRNDLTAQEQIDVGAYLGMKYGLIIPEPTSSCLLILGIFSISAIYSRKRKQI